MCARPLSDKTKTESAIFRMTKGEVAMLTMKAIIEGVTKTEFIKRAVEAYIPTPRTEICVECNRVMVFATTSWELPLDLSGRKHTLTITDVPIMKCDCGETSHNLDVEISVEELVDQLALDVLRYQKAIPERMTIEELFKEEYLGGK